VLLPPDKRSGSLPLERGWAPRFMTMYLIRRMGINPPQQAETRGRNTALVVVSSRRKWARSLARRKNADVGKGLFSVLVSKRRKDTRPTYPGVSPALTRLLSSVACFATSGDADGLLLPAVISPRARGKNDRPTDRPTDRRTDRRTDGPTDRRRTKQKSRDDRRTDDEGGWASTCQRR